MKLTLKEYNTVHKWAEKYVKLEGNCAICGDNGTRSRLERSNISGEYLRDLSDWRILCSRCHKIVDNASYKTSAAAKIRTHCRNGHAYAEVGFRFYPKIKNGYPLRRCKGCEKGSYLRCRARKLARIQEGQHL
jgi:hypothetical protein